MTSAPPNLVAVRRLLLAHLDVWENSRAYPTDLDPDEVGIVGDSAHRGGYHCGADRVISGDYSVVESSRDRAGLTGYASAIDIGQFAITVAGKRHDLRSFSVWLVAQCKASTPDTRDIREVIYSPDGRTVRRWDRLGVRSGGDDSHLWHTHISYHRDATRHGRDLTPLYRRYLTTIGLLAGEDDDMTPGEKWVLHVMNYRLDAIRGNKAVIRVPARPDLGPRYTAYEEPNLLAQAVGADPVDEQAVATAVLAGLTPERIAAAIPAQLARQVADELATRLAG